MRLEHRAIIRRAKAVGHMWPSSSFAGARTRLTGKAPCSRRSPRCRSRTAPKTWYGMPAYVESRLDAYGAPAMPDIANLTGRLPGVSPERLVRGKRVTVPESSRVSMDIGPFGPIQKRVHLTQLDYSCMGVYSLTASPFQDLGAHNPGVSNIPFEHVRLCPLMSFGYAPPSLVPKLAVI
jgi:hypothetical protein